nr:centromere protein Q-like [Nerophis lumbriciformis]
MKPVRGSNRRAKNVPDLKKKTKTTNVVNSSTEHPDSPRRDDDDRQSPKKRKAPLKVGVRGNLKKIRRSSIIALENMMDLAILSTLVMGQREKKESQEHLNILKNRFLTHCAELQVPVKKQEELGNSSQRHQVEKKKSALGQQTLISLEKNLQSVISTLESTEEEASSLQSACNSLRERLEEEEENAKEILQRSHQSVLGLPSHPPGTDESTLEARLRQQVPDTDRDVTARELGKILQKPNTVKNAKILLTQAHINI